MERNLKITSPLLKGEDVLLVQTQLRTCGYDPGPPDGIYGSKTQAAVKALQKDKSLTVDGIVGPKTRAALATAVEENSLRTDFLAYLEAQVGQIYVWSGQGQALSAMADPEGWITKKETNTTNADRAIALYRTRVKEGKNPIRAYDCSGLIMYFLLDMKGVLTSDLSSSGLYGKIKTIERAALQPDDLVFRHDGIKIHHVGVYVAQDTVIEAMGRDVGVVKRNIDASGSTYWNRYGRLPQLGG